MPDITIPDPVVVGDPVEAGDFNTARDAIAEIVGSLNSIENSQLIDGSFETGLTNWVASNIGGGSNAIETSVVVHGAQSFKATATAGGGYVDLDSDDFLNVSAEIDDVFIDGRIYPTAGLQVQAWIEWFDVDDVSISTQQFMDYTFSGGELNTWQRFRGWGRAVATARSYKLSFQLGDGSVAGSVYLDGITTRLNDPYPIVLLDTPVLFYSTNLAGDFQIHVPVVGMAYTASMDFDEAGADFVAKYFYNADTGNWVSGSTYLNLAGDTRYVRTAGGALNAYYSTWR